MALTHTFANAGTLSGTALARRIEHAIAADVMVSVERARESLSSPHAAAIRVAGGVAGFYSAESVLNGAFGVGMSAPVEAEDVAALVAFFEERGVPAALGLCPHADESLLRWLAASGFLVTAFETVSCRLLGSAVADVGTWSDGRDALQEGASVDGVKVRRARTGSELEEWALLEARGWAEDGPTQEDLAIARGFAARGDAVHLVGSVDGEPAGTAMMTISEGVALMNSDSTLPAFRRRGVQSALIKARLDAAAEAGCDLAVIEAAPGSASARNQERAGFRVAYTRVSLERPLGGALLRHEPMNGGAMPPPAEGQGVKIEVVEIQGTGKCSSGHAVGDVWNVTSDVVPAGMCGWAYAAMLPFLQVLRYGGSFPWEATGEAAVCCPDPDNPVVFKLSVARD